MTDTLTCPNCSYKIEVSATLAAQLRDSVRKEFEADVRDLQDQLQQANLKLGEALSAESEVRRERRELEDEKRQLELTIKCRLNEERQKLCENASSEAVDDAALEEMIASRELQEEDSPF